MFFKKSLNSQGLVLGDNRKIIILAKLGQHIYYKFSLDLHFEFECEETGSIFLGPFKVSKYI